MTLAEWLKEARAESGLSYEEAAFRLRGELPEALRVGSDTIRRLERREHPDPILVAALSRVYGKKLPPGVLDELRQVRALLDAIEDGSAKGAYLISAAS